MSWLTVKYETGFQFHSGDTLLRIGPRLGHSSHLEKDVLRELVECNPRKSTRELALDRNTSQSTIYRHLKMIGKVSKLGIWLPHTLSEKNKEDWISVATSILSRLRNGSFHIIRGDERGSFMITLNAKYNGLTSMNLRSLPRKWNFMKKNLVRGCRKMPLTLLSLLRLCYEPVLKEGRR